MVLGDFTEKTKLLPRLCRVSAAPWSCSGVIPTLIRSEHMNCDRLSFGAMVLVVLAMLTGIVVAVEAVEELHTIRAVPHVATASSLKVAL